MSLPLAHLPLVLLVQLMWLAGLGQTPSVAPAVAQRPGGAGAPPDRLLVLAALSPDGRSTLARELERLAPGKYEVVAGPVADGLPTAFSPPESYREKGEPPRPIGGAVGYALPELMALATRTPLAPLAHSSVHPLDDPGPSRRYAVLFADPIVMAVDRAVLARDLGQGSEKSLPQTPEDLCEGRYEEQMVVATPSVGNAGGALFGTLAAAHGDDVVDLLIAFGGNVENTLASSADAAFAKTAELGPPSFALVTRGELERARRAGRTALESVTPWSAAFAVVRGFAAPESAGEEGDRLLELLERMEPEGGAVGVLGQVARAEGWIALRGPTHGIDATDLAVRRAHEFEAPRISRENERAFEWVMRFNTDLKDRLKRKRQRFEDVYDVLALIAMGVFFAYVVMRRKTKESGARGG